MITKASRIGKSVNTKVLAEEKRRHVFKGGGTEV